jgi:hypothetical protein
MKALKEILSVIGCVMLGIIGLFVILAVFPLATWWMTYIEKALRLR